MAAATHWRPGRLMPAKTNIHIMKNFTISLEAFLLIVLLVFGVFGAMTVLDKDESSPGLASPRQEAPAMVMTDLSSNSETLTLD